LFKMYDCNYAFVIEVLTNDEFSYFENMNLSVSLLDPVLYTAQRTFYRSPFLFTVSEYIRSK
jgi:hypothetical protein